MAIKAGRVGVSPGDVDSVGNIIHPALTPATATKLGGVKIGAGLSITSGSTGGKLSVTIAVPAFTADDAGKILGVNSEGTALEWKSIE